MFDRLSNLVARLSGLRQLPARCSFCRRPYKEAAPFAEGYNGVVICGQCVATCGDLIAKEREKLSRQTSVTEV